MRTEGERRRTIGGSQRHKRHEGVDQPNARLTIWMPHLSGRSRLAQHEAHVIDLNLIVAAKESARGEYRPHDCIEGFQ